MKKLLILVSLVMFSIGMTNCKTGNQDYHYSILSAHGESWFGPQDEYKEKKDRYNAYLNSLNIPTKQYTKVISAKSRDEANAIAVAWFNKEVAKVDNDKVNSFVPLKLYLAYILQTLPEEGNSFVKYGEWKEFGDLSLKK